MTRMPRSTIPEASRATDLGMLGRGAELAERPVRGLVDLPESRRLLGGHDEVFPHGLGVRQAR